MKTKASLSILLSTALLAVAAPAAAHDGAYAYRDGARGTHYDSRHDMHYRDRARDRHGMPRWLRRHDGFRHWYSHSRYKRDRHITWARLWDIYTWDRRYGYRYDVRVDVYRDDRRKKRGKGKHRHDRRH